MERPFPHDPELDGPPDDPEPGPERDPDAERDRRIDDARDRRQLPSVDDLLADDWLCGRMSIAQRDAAIAADPVFQAARAARRRELDEQGARTAARINGQAAFMARVRASDTYWEDRPSPTPELIW